MSFGKLMAACVSWFFKRSFQIFLLVGESVFRITSISEPEIVVACQNMIRDSRYSSLMFLIPRCLMGRIVLHIGVQSLSPDDVCILSPHRQLLGNPVHAQHCTVAQTLLHGLNSCWVRPKCRLRIITESWDLLNPHRCGPSVRQAVRCAPAGCVQRRHLRHGYSYVPWIWVDLTVHKTSHTGETRL